MNIVFLTFNIGVPTLLMIYTLKKNGLQRCFVRPEFFLFLSLYLYGVGGYIGYRFLDSRVMRFILEQDPLLVNQAGLLTAISLIATFLGGKLYKPIKVFRRPIADADTAKVSLYFCIVSILLALMFFYSSGGLTGANTHAGVMEAKNAWFHLPYFYFLVAALSIHSSFSEPNNRTSWYLLGIFALINFASGSRRHVFQTAIAVVSAKVRYLAVSNKALYLGGLILVIGGVFVGLARQYLGVSTSLLGMRLLAMSTEYVRGFGALVDNIKYTQGDYLYGASFFDGIVLAFPRFVTGDYRPVKLAKQYAYENADLRGSDVITGQGYSAIAELYINFGPVGAVVFIFLFALFVHSISKYLNKTRAFWMLPVLCAGMYVVGRAGFQTLTGFLLYTSLTGIFILVLANTSKRVSFSDRTSLRSQHRQNRNRSQRGFR